ncbi:O-antigen ligase [Actinokineospora alba]|uniref:O-antigen ligase n=1 Tax=Actinokineospora alba TaxID=504798 RepID=A0A1H0PFR3_9PSEU|nr:O-antigen ligase family protein [Actinokineospora alba]TDP65780.1 O-antigen ligase [Actinokineospora alba]SDI65278.1 O-antigen ligase [Actinokineospora alba]SDP03897.1 O-antigen ligase [Actinokineospora alba]
MSSFLPARQERGDARGLLTVYAVLLFCLPAQLIIGPLGASGTPAGVLGMGLLLFWLVVRMRPGSGIVTGLQPARVAVGLLAIAILVSYSVGMLQPLPAPQVSGADRAMLTLMSWCGIAFVAADLLRTRKSVELLLRTIVILTGVIAVMGLLQFATGLNLAELYKIPGLEVNYTIASVTDRSSFRRVSATASHAIEYGVVLAMVFPIALHLAFYVKERRWLWWGLVALIGIASPMSVSRSATLGMFVAFIVLFAGWNGFRRMVALLVGPVFVVCLRLLIPGLVGTITGLFTGWQDDPSIQGRTDDYVVVGEFINDSPWFGRAFGTFLPEDFITLDNQYLGQIIETGFFGLTALILLFVISFASARGIRARARDEDLRHLGQALAASIAVAALAFVTFDGLGFPMISGLLFLVIGIIGALWRMARRDEIDAIEDPESADQPSVRSST